MISNVKIVVVDEDKLVRDFAVDALEFCVNREVRSFDNGHQAWEYINSNENPHIVIADADVPDISGFDLLKKVKNKFPEKICIIMSHQYQNEKIAKELGADYVYYSEDDPVQEVMRLTDGAGAEVVFDCSGGEATMHALRIARSHTGREKIIKFEGQYHGMYDYMLFSTVSSPLTALGHRRSPIPAPKPVPTSQPNSDDIVVPPVMAGSST